MNTVRTNPDFETAIAAYWMKDGILIAQSKPVRRTVDLIRQNITAVRQFTGSRPVPLLIQLTPSPVPDKETRNFSTQQLPLAYSAMAMLSANGLAQFIMNLLFAWKKPPIPIRIFRKEEDAENWLRQFID